MLATIFLGYPSFSKFRKIKSALFKTLSCFIFLSGPWHFAIASALSDATSLHLDAVKELRVDHSPSGNVRAVFGPIRNPIPSKLVQTDVTAAAAGFFRYHADAFSLQPETTFELTHKGRTTQGQLYVRLAQRHKGIRVLWSEAVLRYYDPSTIRHAIFDFDPSVDDISLVPTLSEQDALERARKFVPNGDVNGPIELVLYPSEMDHRLKQDMLAWAIGISGTDWKGNFRSVALLIDAHGGRILKNIDRVMESVETAEVYVYDTAPQGGSESCPHGHSGSLVPYPSIHRDIDMLYVFLLPESTISSYHYFSHNFQWRSLDNDDQDLKACAHLRGDGAWYDVGLEMIAFGRGWVTQDIVTHEFTHGIEHHLHQANETTPFPYTGLRGAISESFADVFGAFHDDLNWTIGEWSPRGTIRNLQEPGLIFRCLPGNPDLDRPCPDHVKDLYCGRENACGTHFNNNILNHAAYELATNWNPDSAGDNREEVGKIYFDVLRTELTSQSGFLDVRKGVVGEVADRYNTTKITAAQMAFDDVGLVEDWETPIDCLTDDVCDGSGPGQGGSCLTELYIEEEETGGMDTTDSFSDDATSYTTLMQETIKLRNEVLSKSDLGKHYMNSYDSHVSSMAWVLLTNPRIFNAGSVVFPAFLPGILELRRVSDTSTIVTQDLIDKMEGFLEDVAKATDDSSLSTMLNTELDRLDWDALAGKTFAEAWEYMIENIELP